MKDQKGKQCRFIFYSQFWFTRGAIHSDHDCKCL